MIHCSLICSNVNEQKVVITSVSQVWIVSVSPIILDEEGVILLRKIYAGTLHTSSGGHILSDVVSFICSPFFLHTYLSFSSHDWTFHWPSFLKIEKKIFHREIICHIFRVELWLILNQDSFFSQYCEQGARGEKRK